MRKILSLLALLMTTVAAMATAYTGKLTYKILADYDYVVPEGENVIIESTGDNQYSLTLKNCDYTQSLGLNLGDITFAGLSGTTTDGVTTINAAAPAATFTGAPNFTLPEGDLLVKFNDTKAYVAYDGKFDMGTGSRYSLQADFGDDDFSTGGGGGGTTDPSIEGTPIAGLTNFAPGGDKFEYPMTINWDKQYFKAVIDVTDCVGQSENILSVGEDVSAWKIGGWHFYYSKNHNSYGTNALKVDYLTTGGAHPLSTVKNGYTGEITIEISKANGCLVNGEPFLDNYSSSVTGTWQENTANFWTLTDLGVGSKEGNTRSYATIKYATVIDIADTPDPDPKPEFPTPSADAKQYTTDNFVPAAGGYPAGTFSATAYVSNNGGTADIQIDKVNIPDWAVDSKINVAGVTVGTEGEFTTFSGSDLQLMTEAGDVYKASVTGKAKDDKLYLVISSDDEVFGWGGAIFTFGDDNFPATPEPVEYPINFDKDANSTRTDRVLRSVSLTEEGGQAQTISTNSSNKPYQDKTTETLTVKAGGKVTATFDYSGEWMHGYVYVDENNDKQFSYKEGSTDQTGTELKAFSFYSGSFTDDSEGYNSNGDYITGNARSVINPPSFTAPTVPGTYRIRFKVDWNSVDPGGQLAADGTPTGNNGILKNGGIILDATLVVEEAEEPFAPVVRTATDVANVTYGGTTTNYTANEVEVNEYEQGKLKVTYKDLTVGNTRLGDLTIDNVTSTVGEDGTETLTTTATEGTWSNVSDNQIVLTLIPNETSAISNFAATLTPGAEDNTIEKLNLAFDVTLGGSDANVVFGAQKVLPVKYTNKLEVKSQATGEIQTYEKAEISVLDKGNGKYEFTIPSFSDDEGDESDPIIFEADGVETDGKIVYTATDVEYPMTGAWGDYNMVATVSIVSAESANGTLTAKFNISLGGAEDFVLGYGVSLWESETRTVTAPANITFGGQTVNFDEATLEITEDPEDVYSVTYKNLTINGNEIGDFTISNVTVTGDEDNANNLTTTDSEGTWTRVVENNALNVEAGSTVAIRNFEGTVTATDAADKVVVKFGLNITGEWADVIFGEKAAEEPKEDYAINFDKDGQNNHASRRTTSVSLQQVGKAVQTLTFNSSLNGYEDHSADMEFTVEAGSEVATTFGYNGEWMHGYVYIDLDGNKQFDVNADDLANSPELVAYSYYNDLNSKGETASANVNVTPPTFTAPATPGTYRIRFKIDWNNVDPGGCVDSGNHILNNGGGVWDATLVVTEPIVDGINSINAAANGDAQVFTVSGAKVNSLQKGVNIVRTADGKTVKVVVK